jgi:hypothetical protein
MATRNQVRAMITARPFRPFTVRTNSGQTYTVYHPELVSCTVDGREMQLNDDDGTHLLGMLCVEAIEPLPAPQQTRDAGG